MKTFTLWPHMPSIKAHAMQTIERLDTKICWTIKVEPYKAPKSNSQRKFFHKLCAMLGRELGYELEDIKEYAKQEYFGTRVVVIGGKPHTRADGHSERLGIKEYGELIDLVYRLGAQAGVVLPDPEDYRSTRNE